jgi:hypothetical protein
MVEFTTGEDVLGEQLEFLVLLPEGSGVLLGGPGYGMVQVDAPGFEDPVYG